MGSSGPIKEVNVFCDLIYKTLLSTTSKFYILHNL